MESPYSSLGVFLGYCDHSSVIHQTNGGAFDWQRIVQVRHAIQERCRSLSPTSRTLGTYEPTFTSCFGHSDDILYMLVDSFADAVQLTSGIPQIENYTLANWYKRDFFPPSVRPLIAEPVDWLSQLGSSHPQPPLKTVTHIKLSGILSIAFGLHSQLSATRLIAQTVSDLITTLRDLPLRSEHQKLFAQPSTGVNIFDSFRMTMLAPVGSDDIVLVTHSHNYSVAASTLAAVRCLTLGKLFRFASMHGDSLAACLKSEDVFKTQSDSSGDCPIKFLQSFVKLAGNWKDEVAEEGPTCFERLAANHLLAASYTTLAVNQPLVNLNELKTQISGVVSVQANADINPGHEVEAGETISSKWLAIDRKVDSLTLKEHRFVLPGKHDLSLYFSESPEKSEQSCVQLSEFFKFIQSLFSSQTNERNESGFQDISTNLAIPIPRIRKVRGTDDSAYTKLLELIEPKIPSEGHVNTMDALETISHTISTGYLLDHTLIFERMLHTLEMNPSTRAAAHRLFAEFAQALGDPIHIDSVVDLSDAFHSLYAIMERKSLASEYPVLVEDNDHDNGLTSHKVRGFFVEAIDGLVHALLMRTGNSSVKREQRFGDLQGSITSLLAAADTAIKSSLGILRHRLYPTQREYSQSRRSVTGLIVPMLRERATARQLVYANMGLTLINMDRMHVFNPKHFVRVVHEVAHLYFDKVVRAGFHLTVSKLKGLDDAKVMRFLTLQAAEVFSEMVTQKIIFGSDVDLFVRNQLSELGALETEVADQDLQFVSIESLVLAKIQILYRLFLVAMTPDNSSHDSAGTNDHANDFCEFAQRWSGQLKIPKIGAAQFKKLCFLWAQSVSDVLPKFLPEIRQEVDKAIGIVEKLESEGQSMDEIRNLVEAALADGIPLPLKQTDAKINEGLAVFALIHAYVKASSEDGPSESKREASFKLCTDVMKSLWHISTRQKRRRLAELMEVSMGSLN